MKKNKIVLRTLLFAIAVFCAAILVSCEKIEGEMWERPDDMSSCIPDYSILLTGSWSVSGHIASFNIQPRTFANFDYWQLRIKSIDYYIDDVFIKKETQEPYTFNYTAPGLSLGHHQIKANVKIEDLVNHKEIVISPTKEFEVKPSSQPDISGGFQYSASWSKSGNNVYFSINDIRIWNSLTESGWTLTTLSLYFDDNLIETLYNEPFNFTYAAKDLSQGNHYFVIKGKIVNTLNAQEMELTNEIEVSIP